MKREAINCLANPRLMNSVSSDIFKIYAKADEESVELLVFDAIGKDPWTGEGLGAADVASYLADNRGKPVSVRINSPGGYVSDGIAVYNSLIQHDAPVTTTVEGLSASAATIIQMAGSTVRMFANTRMMVHKAWSGAVGNADLMRDVAEWLDSADEQIAKMYSAKSGRKIESMLKLMTGKIDGTLMSAEQALEEKLIDEIIPLPKGKNRLRNESDDVAEIQAVLTNERRVKAANATARIRLMEIGR